MRILMVQLNPIVGDIKGNKDKIIAAIERGRQREAQLILFPELSLCGYPPEDLLLLSGFEIAIQKALAEIIQASKNLTVIVGLPTQNPSGEEKRFFNSAAIIVNQQLLGYQHKILLPTYDVFDERRYFEPGKEVSLWDLQGQKVAITICEDIWQNGTNVKFTTYSRDPIQEFASLHPDLMLNLSASPFSLAKAHKRLNICAKAAQSLRCPVLLCNQVGGNDSLIFDGHSLYVDREGKLCVLGKGFEECDMFIDLSQSLPPISLTVNSNEELFQALVLGLKDYFLKSGFTKACLGLSGGIDSAIVACIAAAALGKEQILAVAMPSRFSSKESLIDAQQLAKNLGIAYKEISIENPFESYLNLLFPHFSKKEHDITEENLQARIRGMILMALSNKEGYIVLSTGNKSEMAMGYATLYGDMCGGLGVINDVTKTQIYALAHWINRNGEIIPQNTISKPPSAELKFNQKDSDTLPDYSIIDNVLLLYIEEHLSPQEIASKYNYPLKQVLDLIKRIHQSEYKRRQAPPGLRISEKAFSIGRRFPIVHRWI